MAETLIRKGRCLNERRDMNRPCHNRAADSGQNESFRNAIESGITGLTLWALELEFITLQYVLKYCHGYK